MLPPNCIIWKTAILKCPSYKEVLKETSGIGLNSELLILWRKVIIQLLVCWQIAATDMLICWKTMSLTCSFNGGGLEDILAIRHICHILRNNAIGLHIWRSVGRNILKAGRDKSISWMYLCIFVFRVCMLDILFSRALVRTKRLFQNLGGDLVWSVFLLAL